MSRAEFRAIVFGNELRANRDYKRIGTHDAIAARRAVDVQMATAERTSLNTRLRKLKRPSDFTGNFCIDDEVLREEGIEDLDRYSVTPGTTDFMQDFFI